MALTRMGGMCSYKTMFCDTGARAMPAGANVRGRGDD